MGRTKKEEVVVDETPVVDEVVETTEEVAEVVTPKAVSAPKTTVLASYKTRTVEGDRIAHKYEGVGATLAEALANIVGCDEDVVDEYNKPFPARINSLVNITVKRGEYKFDRACAPHVANDILTGKNVALVTRLFGL